MNNIILENMSNNNQSIIGNISNPSMNSNGNNMIDPMLITATKTNLDEKTFECMIKNIKAENLPLVPDEFSELDDVTEITATSVNNQNEFVQHQKNKDEFKCIMKSIKAQNFPLVSEINKFDDALEVITISVNNQNKFDLSGDNIPIPKSIPIQLNETTINNEKYLNVPTSNLQKQKNTSLTVNLRQVKDICASSPLSTYQIPKIISNTSRLTQIAHICSKCCVWCTKNFAVFDNPNHIGRIRDIEKQNAFLKIELTLKIDSCLCDRCFKFLEKTYKSYEIEKRKGICSDLMDSIDISTNIVDKSTNAIEISSNIINKSIDMVEVASTMPDISTDMDNVSSVSNLSVKQVDVVAEKESSVANVKKYSNVSNRIKRLKRSRSRKRKRQHYICSVHKCSQYAIHQIPIDECKKIKHILSLFDFTNIVLIQSKRVKSEQLDFPSLSVCEDHLCMIDVIRTCQLCCNQLDDNLNCEDWKMYDQWNSKLLCNNIPLILQPGMFICTNCHSYISEKNSLSTIDMERLRLNVIKRYDLRLKVFGSLHNNITETCQESNADIPYVIAKIFKSDNFTKVKFADPLITAIHYFRPGDNEHCFKKRKKRKANCSNFEVKLKKNASDSFINDNLLQTINECLNYNSNTNNNTLQDSNDEKSSNSVTSDSQLSDVEKDNSQMMKINHRDISTNNFYVNHNPRPNGRIVKLMNLLKKEDNINCNNVSKIIPEHHEDSLHKRLNENTVNCVLNKTNNNLTNIKDSEYGLNHDIVAACMEVEEDMLPTHVSSILDNKENNVSENVISDQCTPVTTSLCSNRNLSEINLENDENLPLITNVYSSQSAFKVRHIEPDENMSMTDNFYLNQNNSDDKDVETDQLASNLHSNQNLCEVIEDIETDENMLMTSDLYSNHQSVCEVEDVNIDGNELPINSVHSDKNVCNVEDVESDKNDIMISSIYSQQTTQDVDQDKNIIDLDEDDQTINTEDLTNDEMVFLDESNFGNMGFIKSLNNTGNPVEIRRKLHKVVCNRILKKVKKEQKLNETSEINDILLYENENNINSYNKFAEDDIIKMYKKKNFNQNFNSIGILNTFSQCENEDFYNSDFDVLNISSDEDEVTLMTEENYDCKIDDCVNGDVVADGSKTNKQEIQIKSTCSLDPNIADSFKFYQTLKKVPDFHSKKNFQDEENSFDANISDYQNIPDNEIMSVGETVSDCGIISDNEIINNENITIVDKIISNSESLSGEENVSDDTQEQSTTRYQFPQPIKLTNDRNNDDSSYEINLELDSSLSCIYENLHSRFKDHSEVFNYLMENERMIYKKELVLAENADYYASKYISKHLELLYNNYGEPQQGIADVSYLYASPERVRKYSERSFSNDYNDIVTSNGSKMKAKTILMPVALSQDFKFSQVDKKKIKAITQPQVSFQSSAATIKYITVGQHKPSVYRTTFQPYFQLPTAVRSKGFQFLQNKPLTISSHPNIFTDCIRNKFNINNNSNNNCE